MGENAKCFATLSTLVLVIYYAFTFLFQEKSRQFYSEKHKKTQTHSLPLKSYLLQNAQVLATKRRLLGHYRISMQCKCCILECTTIRFLR